MLIPVLFSFIKLLSWLWSVLKSLTWSFIKAFSGVTITTKLGLQSGWSFFYVGEVSTGSRHPFWTQWGEWQRYPSSKLSWPPLPIQASRKATLSGKKPIRDLATPSHLLVTPSQLLESLIHARNLKNWKKALIANTAIWLAHHYFGAEQIGWVWRSRKVLVVTRAFYEVIFSDIH